MGTPDCERSVKCVTYPPNIFSAVVKNHINFSIHSTNLKVSRKIMVGYNDISGNEVVYQVLAFCYFFL